MKWLILAFLGVAAASQIPAWLPEKEYTFHYTSAVLAGIPQLGKQHAGLKLKAIARAQRFPDQTIRIQLEDAKFQNFNEEVEWEGMTAWSPRRGEEGNQVPLSIKRHLEAPFKVVACAEGLVQKVQFEADEPEFVTNIKKAAVSHLFTLSKTKLTHEGQFRATVQKMETSIVGHCETHYIITKLPEYLAREFEQREQIPMQELCEGKEYFEVLKTKNLKVCKERPIYQHVYGANAIPDGSMGAAAPFADEATVTKAVVCGTPEAFHLRKITNEHKFLINPTGKFETKERMAVTAATRIALRSVEQKVREIADVKAPKAKGSLMYEFPAEDALTSTTSKKALIPRVAEEEDQFFLPQVAMPDMISAPKTFYPNTKTLEENKEQIVQAFMKIVEHAHKSPESYREDVAGTAVMAARAMVRLGFEDIKALWNLIEARVPVDAKVIAHHAFLDLLSVCGTNPCVKFIIEAVKTRQVAGEAGAWIAANAIRNIKTPTEEVLKELTDLLKHEAVQADRNMASTVALALTHLVHKACINENAVYEFPVKAYGRFCDQKTAIITRDLIPFLAEKLNAAAETDIHQIITYINALGNLGHDGAALHLLRAVEGRPTRHPHPRSVAVYQLFKVAAANPTLYRPVILALAVNEAEAEEVRMAAVTVLPHTRPHAAHLNLLAVRTWFEPSRQVAAYITTTLKTLAELPAHHHLYNLVAEQAQQAFKLAKPTNTGIQMSHNAVIAQFLDNLKAAVNFKLQYVTSAESAFPKNIFIKDQVVTKSHATQNFEAAINFEGAEYIVNKMYEAYFALKPQQEQQRMAAQQNFIKNIVHVESRWARKPEAHVTVKVMGLQRIYSFDNRMVEQLLEEVTRNIIEAQKRQHVLAKDFVKIIDLNGMNGIIAAEAGLPVYISHQTPLVIHAKAALKAKLNDLKNGEVALTIKPVVNYKQITQAAVFCPFSKQFLVLGVDTHLHVAAPIKAEVAMQDGQFHVTVKTPKDEESQKAKPVIKLRVKPYTAAFDINAAALVPVDKCANAKIIKSKNQLQTKEYQLGKALGMDLGLDLKLKFETEHPHADFAEFVQGLFQHKFFTLLTLPLPLKTVRNHAVELIYNPKDSATKAASVAFSFGHGQKLSSSHMPEVITYSSCAVPANVDALCRQEAEQWKLAEEKDAFKMEERKQKFVQKFHQMIQEEKELEKKRKLTEQEIQECRLEAENMWEQKWEMELRAEVEIKKEMCEREKIAAEVKTKCMAEQAKQARPFAEVEAYCNKKAVQYKQRHTSYKSNWKSLNSILTSIQNAARAVAVHVHAALHGENFVAERKVKAQLIITEDKSQGNLKENQIKLNLAVKTPHFLQPYVVDVHAIRKLQRPISQWDKDAILLEAIHSKINIKAVVGRRQEQQHRVQVDILAERSAEQKAFARNHAAWRLCDADLAKNQQMTANCMKARHHAAALDVIQAELAVPKLLARNPYVATVADVAKAYFIPYLAIEETTFNQQSTHREHVKVHAKFASNGKAFTLAVAANKLKTILKNVRVAPAFEGLMPNNVMKSLPMHLLKKFTQNGAPSRCVVEGNKVQTFDKVVYDYTMNDCEHVIFKDCTDAPKVMVAVQKTPAMHIVKAVIDDNKYELELVKATRGLHKLKVNGQIIKGLQQGKLVIFEDKNNQITKFEDGVFEIFNAKYGMIVRADRLTAEVVTFQHRLRNLACGLCGDLNDEKTADVRSAQQCVMSHPRLAAYSFMVEDRKCAGIPTADRALFNKEAAQCVKKAVVPAKVYDIFLNMHHANKMRQATLRHVEQQQGQKICISKRQVKVCGADALPKEIVPREMPFFCVAADREGRILQKMAQMGERIERAEVLPTAFTATVYEPLRC